MDLHYPACGRKAAQRMNMSSVQEGCAARAAHLHAGVAQRKLQLQRLFTWHQPVECAHAHQLLAQHQAIACNAAVGPLTSCKSPLLEIVASQLLLCETT